MKKTWTLFGVTIATMSALAFPGEALSQSITIHQSNGDGMKQRIVIKGDKPCPPPVVKQKPACAVPQVQQVQRVIVVPQVVYLAPRACEMPRPIYYAPQVMTGPWDFSNPLYYDPRRCYSYTPNFWP